LASNWQKLSRERRYGIDRRELPRLDPQFVRVSEAAVWEWLGYFHAFSKTWNVALWHGGRSWLKDDLQKMISEFNLQNGK
jgi:hypothetical protein